MWRLRERKQGYAPIHTPKYNKIQLWDKMAHRAALTTTIAKLVSLPLVSNLLWQEKLSTEESCYEPERYVPRWCHSRSSLHPVGSKYMTGNSQLVSLATNPELR